MTARPAAVASWAWSRSDRLALVVLLAVAGAALGWLCLRRTAPMGLSPPVDPARVEAVCERIDPNTASAASLRRLSLIGPAKAEAIVAYRLAQQRAGRPRPFRFAEDIADVPGIGETTVARSAHRLAIPSRKDSP